MRLTRSVLLLTVVVLAAALLTPSPATGSSTPRPPAPLAFRRPVPLSSFAPLRTVMSHEYSLESGDGLSDHEWSGEPGIEVDRWGTIYVSGVCCVVAASPVWVSRDDGRTFREMRTPAHIREWTVGAEGDLEVDDAGRVFFADTTAANIMFTRWSAQGRSWDFTIPGLGIIPVDDRPWLAWTPDNLYLYINSGSYIQVYRSPDGGLLWVAGAPLTWKGSISGQPFWPGHMAADRTRGTVYVTGPVPGTGDRQQMGSAVSTDGGRTFRNAVVFAPRAGEEISPIFTGITTVDDAGNAYAAWSTWTRRGCSVFYGVSTDQGASWSKPVRVSSGPGCATFPWIDATARGRVAIAYYQTPTTRQQPPPEPGLVGEPPEAPPFQDNVPNDAPWHLRVASITGADTAHPAMVDAQVPFPTPLFLGPMLRQPWDYIGVDLGRDGIIRTVFVEKYKDSAPRTWFVASRPVF
jgi:hypothetical protein